MNHPILSKILWEKGSKSQLWGAILGAFLGILLLLSALQLFVDIGKMTSGGNPDNQYVLINKKVNLFNTFGASSAFTQEEIDQLKAQEFINDIGLFTPNQFKVSASSPMLGFYTELFFEAIKDDYLDVPLKSFRWNTGDREIPIVLSRDYLALYNFGFAPSQGLPQFTPNTIKKVSVDINLRGNGMRQTLTGRIVGFSDRINSILVPKSFMDWANQKFGGDFQPAISRIILKTDQPYSKELEDYLKTNNFEVTRGKLIGGQVGVMINIILGIIAVIGLIIMILSILVFILNFELIISQSSHEIGLLLQLGYQTNQISRVLIKRLFTLFGGVILSAFLVMLIAHIVLSKWLEGQSLTIDGNLHWVVYVATILVLAFFALISSRIVKAKVTALFQ